MTGSRLLGRHAARRWTGSRDVLLSVWGANTDVGKSLVSVGLCRAATRLGLRCSYVKPVQTGDDMDANKVALHAPGAACTTLHSFQQPLSPHLAARGQNPPTDDELLSGLVRCLEEDQECSASRSPEGSLWLLETAGGVLSPSPNGALQADLYRPLRLDSLLVGDPRLGGIGATLSALESLRMRGYTVTGIAFVGDEIGNADFVAGETKLPVWKLPAPPPPQEPLTGWVEETQASFEQELQSLMERQAKARADKAGMRSRALQTVWWPFTQHKFVTRDDITVIDSAAGDHFHALEFGSGESSSRVRALVDSSASWWTQSLGHGDAGLTMAAAEAAGRYGHVLFPGCMHEPALHLAEATVRGPGQGWAARAFYSDNGSTAVEVALKMACRLYAKRMGIALGDDRRQQQRRLCVVAQKDCYHGDTLGAMDVAEPCIFNEGQHPWYEPKGLFLPTPRCAWVGGSFCTVLPSEMGGSKYQLPSHEAIFDLEGRTGSPEAEIYSSFISTQLDDFEARSGATLAALVMEPIVTGAGGMYMVDPLFQSLLALECRRRSMAIVYDEVFSGMWRLGVDSCRKLLQVDPDVACYAKMLTGGLVPLSLTLASDEVFRAFDGDTAAEALLHGHSFAGNPVGCAAALHSFNSLASAVHRPMWEQDRVKSLSQLPNVAGALAVGTVLSVELKAEGGGGYAAGAASASAAKYLRHEGGIFVRPLGNVLYSMVTPFTPPDECERILSAFENALLHAQRGGDVDTSGCPVAPV